MCEFVCSSCYSFNKSQYTLLEIKVEDEALRNELFDNYLGSYINKSFKLCPECVKKIIKKLDNL